MDHTHNNYGHIPYSKADRSEIRCSQIYRIGIENDGMCQFSAGTPSNCSPIIQLKRIEFEVRGFYERRKQI